MKSIILSSVLLGAAAAAQVPQSPQTTPPTPTYLFLNAADNGDYATMQALIDGKVLLRDGGRLSPADFISKIQPCYLRRVYENDIAHSLVAAWMCAEGPTKSRVMIVQVGEKHGKVGLSVQLEQEHPVPAPARDGPALAPEPEKR